MNLRMLSKTVRPSSTPATMLAKLFVHQNDVGGLAGDVRARNFHGDTDIGLAQRRRIVHAVPGYRDNVFLDCRAATMRRFWSTRVRAKMISGASSAAQLRARHALQPVARDHPRAGGADQVNLTCDGQGGRRMIARDHDHLDTGGAAPGDRRGHFESRRVLKPTRPKRVRPCSRRERS